MIVTAWNNSEHHTSGGGYGVRVNAEDRADFFERNWKTVQINMEGSSAWIEMNVAKKSFWRKDCGELISKEIGKWLIKNGLAPWEKGSPPKLKLEPDEKRFRLSRY